MKRLLIAGRSTRHILLVATVALTIGTLAGGCRQTSKPSAVQAAEAQAQRDSTKAARLDSTAKHYYTLGQQAADSATFYHLQSTHVKTQATTADSATLQRFFAGY